MSADLLTISSTIINDNEFPSLGLRGTPSGSFSLLPTTSGYSSPNHSVPPGYGKEHAQPQRPNYANLMRGTDALAGGSEFHIQSEDFPALPGAIGGLKSALGQQQAASLQHAQQQQTPASAAVQNLTDQSALAQHSLLQTTSDIVNSATEGRYNEAQNDHNTLSSGITTHTDGEVTSIPPGMLNDQFGMAGLVTYLRAVDNPAIVALALGHDLTTLGLNLNLSERQLYTTFGGPWSDYPCRTQDLDANVPEEYLTNSSIRPKLPNIKLNKLSEDVLFYLFYNCPGEVYQVAAAGELYSRDWRFHKGECVWLTRSQYGGVKEQTGSYEKGSYNVFDPIQWRKIPKDMMLEYKHLEERPKMPSSLQMSTNPSCGSSAAGTPVINAGPSLAPGAALPVSAPSTLPGTPTQQLA